MAKITREMQLSNSLLRVFRSSVPLEENNFYEHHHTAFEITMVLKGSGVYATGVSEFDFKSGDIFFFSTDEYHWLKRLDSRTDFLNIHFEPRFIWSDNFGISSRELVKIFLNRKTNPHNKIRSESSDRIKKLIYRIEREGIEQKSEYEIMLKVHLMNILVEMIRSYDGQIAENDTFASGETIRYIEKSLSYIEENLESDLTLEELSVIAQMSKNYFCRQFKKLNGISPFEYITIKRIERAVRYLESTNLTRTEIALRCGYNNTANFYHAFKKVTGKNPGDYKTTSSLKG